MMEQRIWFWISRACSEYPLLERACCAPRLTAHISSSPPLATSCRLCCAMTSFLSLGTFYAYATPSFVRSHLFDAVGLPLLGGSAAGGKLGNDSAHAAGHVALREVDKRLEDDRKEVEDGVIRRDAGCDSPCLHLLEMVRSLS